MTNIAKAEGWMPLIQHIGEFKDHGLVKIYDVSRREIYLSQKGMEVCEMLQAVKDRLDSDEGADEYYAGWRWKNDRQD